MKKEILSELLQIMTHRSGQRAGMAFAYTIAERLGQYKRINDLFKAICLEELSDEERLAWIREYMDEMWHDNPWAYNGTFNSLVSKKLLIPWRTKKMQRVVQERQAREQTRQLIERRKRSCL